MAWACNECQKCRFRIRICPQCGVLPWMCPRGDSEIRFSRILLMRDPANDQELLYLYAALLGHAIDLRRTAHAE